MEIRAAGGGEAVVTGEGGETLEIGGPDTGDRDLDRFASGRTKVAEKSSHPACGDSVTVRMGKYDVRPGGPQTGNRCL